MVKIGGVTFQYRIAECHTPQHGERWCGLKRAGPRFHFPIPVRWVTRRVAVGDVRPLLSECDVTHPVTMRNITQRRKSCVWRTFIQSPLTKTPTHCRPATRRIAPRGLIDVLYIHTPQ